LRRLYSTFAGGWPGTGLLLMRVVVGSALIVGASSILWSAPPPINTTIMSVFLAGCGILLIPGIWTPVAGTLVAVIEIWQILTPAGDRWVALLVGTIGGALAMLGPGLWSVDARLFGWKRVEAPPRKSSSNSP
jgi:putative oxidoreductase